MTRRHSLQRFVRTAVVVPLAAVGFAACGDDDDDAETVASDVRAEITQASNELEERATEASEAATEASAAVADVATSLEDVARDAVELAMRNLAAQLGSREFEDAGYELDGGLDCTAAVSDSNDSVDIDCTGTTSDGEAAELTGTTDQLPDEAAIELSGSFTGTVAGAEVFTTDSLSI